MANIRGAFTTSNFEQYIKKYDVRDMIFQLDPDINPFLSLLGKLSKLKAQDVEFHWFEDDYIGRYTQINNATGYDNAATDLVVDDADIFQPYDIVKNTRTNEVMLITAVNTSTNTITVTRGWGSTSAAAINDNDYLFRLGSAMAEGYTAPDAMVTAKSRKSNYIQIFSKTVKITETANAIATYGGNRRNYERRKKANELKRDIEVQFLFGEPKLDSSGPRYQTGGVYYFLKGTAPELDASGSSLTESAFLGHLEDVFAHGSDERFLFAGPRIIGDISAFASDKQRLTPGLQKKYGISVREYLSPFGVVNLVLDKNFTGPYAGMAFILDVKELVYRYLDGLDFKLLVDIQPKNVHYLLDEYQVHCGLEIHNAERHGIIYNVA
jgi:hypothetical protein